MERKRSVRRRQKKPFSERAKDHCRLFTAFLFSNVGIIILVVLYMTAGSSMFSAIEKEHTLLMKNETNRNRNSLVSQLWNVSIELNGYSNKSMFNEEVNKRVLDYQGLIIKAIRGGWRGHDESGQEHWTFAKAFLYSLTVITTIGYGNLCPRTEWGKVATILYAIIGMPLFLLYLSNIGDILAKSFKWIYAKVCLCRICPGVAKRRALRERRKIRALTHNDINERDYHIEEALENISNSSGSSQLSDEDLEDDIVDEIEGTTNTVTVPITVCLMIMIGVMFNFANCACHCQTDTLSCIALVQEPDMCLGMSFNVYPLLYGSSDDIYIFLGAIMFAEWESWLKFDGFYFCFISLSSIGFGDFVPGDKIFKKGGVVDLTFIACAVYLLLGMALIAMCFNLMQEQVIYKMRAFKRGIRRCFRCDR